MAKAYFDVYSVLRCRAPFCVAFAQGLRDEALEMDEKRVAGK
jgi:hypothetical protein